jgi:cytidine diphosphoramidate kinase
MRLKKKKFDKNLGIVFWVTGLAGSGKTRTAKILVRKLSKDLGPTLVFSGDNLRKIFDLKSYDYNGRSKIVRKYSNFINFILKQKINVVFAVIGMMDHSRTYNKKIFKNYFEIYIKTNFAILRKNNKKKLYAGGKANVVGKDIKPEFPKKPDIIFVNNFKKDLKKQVEVLYKKIKKKLPDTFLV